MKVEYIKPETLAVELVPENGAIICASGDSIFENPGVAGRFFEED